MKWVLLAAILANCAGCEPQKPASEPAWERCQRAAIFSATVQLEVACPTTRGDLAKCAEFKAVDSALTDALERCNVENP